MKLTTLILHLNKIIENNPNHWELDIVYAKDAEGNGFKKVFFPPSVGHYKNDDFDDEVKQEEINSICIN